MGFINILFTIITMTVFTVSCKKKSDTSSVKGVNGGVNIPGNEPTSLAHEGYTATGTISAENGSWKYTILFDTMAVRSDTFTEKGPSPVWTWSAEKTFDSITRTDLTNDSRAQLILLDERGQPINEVSGNEFRLQSVEDSPSFNVIIFVKNLRVSRIIYCHREMKLGGSGEFVLGAKKSDLIIPQVPASIDGGFVDLAPARSENQSPDGIAGFGPAFPKTYLTSRSTLKSNNPKAFPLPASCETLKNFAAPTASLTTAYVKTFVIESPRYKSNNGRTGCQIARAELEFNLRLDVGMPGQMLRRECENSPAEGGKGGRALPLSMKALDDTLLIQSYVVSGNATTFTTQKYVEGNLAREYRNSGGCDEFRYAGTSFDDAEYKDQFLVTSTCCVENWEQKGIPAPPVPVQE